MWSGGERAITWGETEVPSSQQRPDEPQILCALLLGAES